MARGRATGFVLERDRLEWVTLVQAGEQVRRVDQGLEVLAPDDTAVEDAPDQAAVVDQVRSVCEGVRGDATLGLPSSDVLLRVVELPAVDEDELADMVELQADKFAPFPIETMATSYEVLERTEDHYRVLVAAVRNDAVDAHARLLIEAGRPLTTVDCCILGWWQVLQDGDAIPVERRCAQIIVGANGVELMVVQNEVPLVFRSLGGVDLAAADLAAEIAQELSHTLITVELEHGSRPCRVMLWAYKDRLDAIAEALRAQRIGEMDTHALEALPSVSEGLARRLMRGGGVDLTPQAWRDAEAAARRRRRMIQWIVGVVGVWLVCVVSLVGLLSWRKGVVKRLQAKRQQWEAPAMDVRELRRRVLMIDRYTDMSHSALECLREVSRFQPDGVDLASFVYTKGDAVRINAKADDRSRIYGFKQALDASGLFEQVELGSQNQDMKVRRWSFDMVLDLPGGEETGE